MFNIPFLSCVRSTESLPLDGVSNIWSARSTRRLLTSYTGDVILARRSSDSAELGFSAAEYLDGTLDAWVGAGDGFAVTYYDQSGNGRDWTNSVASEQRKIWESGSILTKSGIAASKAVVTPSHMENSETVGLPSSASFIIACAWELLPGMSESFLLLDEQGAGKYCGNAINSNINPWYANAGTPTARLNGVNQSWSNRNDVFDAVAAASVSVIRIDNIDMSGWSGVVSGAYQATPAQVPWLFEEVILTSSTDADTVEAAMMDYLGL